MSKCHTINDILKFCNIRIGLPSNFYMRLSKVYLKKLKKLSFYKIKMSIDKMDAEVVIYIYFCIEF